jgi:hypothetical protein
LLYFTFFKFVLFRFSVAPFGSISERETSAKLEESPGPGQYSVDVNKVVVKKQVCTFLLNDFLNNGSTFGKYFLFSLS